MVGTWSNFQLLLGFCVCREIVNFWILVRWIPTFLLSIDISCCTTHEQFPVPLFTATSLRWPYTYTRIYSMAEKTGDFPLDISGSSPGLYRDLGEPQHGPCLHHDQLGAPPSSGSGRNCVGWMSSELQRRVGRTWKIYVNMCKVISWLYDFVILWFDDLMMMMIMTMMLWLISDHQNSTVR